MLSESGQKSYQRAGPLKILHVHCVSDLGPERQRYKDSWLHCCLRSSTKKPRCNLGPSCIARPTQLLKKHWTLSVGNAHIPCPWKYQSCPFVSSSCIALLHVPSSWFLVFLSGQLVSTSVMTTSSTSSKSKHRTI